MVILWKFFELICKVLTWYEKYLGESHRTESEKNITILNFERFHHRLIKK